MRVLPRSCRTLRLSQVYAARVRERPALLIALGWLLLIAAWIGGNPPFAGADEQWHYARTFDVGVGAPAKAQLGGNPLQIAWTNQATRAVTIPAGLPPRSVGCYIFDPRKPVTECPPSPPGRFVPPVGTYEPLPYLLPALARQPASTPTAALMLGRIASAL